MISMLDHTLSQNLDSVSQTLVKKYSFAYYSKASAVVVAFYLRGGRYPARATPGVDTPECLTTNVVPIETLRESARHRIFYPPQTPVRERMEMSWGSGLSTPGLVRSDSSSSSTMGMDLEDELEDLGELEMEDREPEVEVEVFAYRSHKRSNSGSTTSKHSHAHSHSSDSENVLLFHPNPKDDGMLSAESMPITPTTPMLEFNPFGQQPVAIVAHPPKCDKENYVPHDAPRKESVHLPPLSHVQAPHAPCVVDLEDPEDRQALLAIVP